MGRQFGHQLPGGQGPEDDRDAFAPARGGRRRCHLGKWMRSRIWPIVIWVRRDPGRQLRQPGAARWWPQRERRAAPWRAASMPPALATPNVGLVSDIISRPGPRLLYLPIPARSLVAQELTCGFRDLGDPRPTISGDCTSTFPAPVDVSRPPLTWAISASSASRRTARNFFQVTIGGPRRTRARPVSLP